MAARSSAAEVRDDAVTPDPTDLRSRLVEEIATLVRAGDFAGVVVGHSDPVRAALACGLAAEAVGPENVLGLVLPVGPGANGADREQAAFEALGVRWMGVELDDAFRALLGALAGRRERAERLDRATGGGAGPDGDGRPREVRARAAVAPRLRHLAALYFGDLLGYAVLAEGTGAATHDPLADLDPQAVRDLARAFGLPPE